MMSGGVILVIVGVLVYLLARRGRPVGTHPCCVTCNFDLTGLPPERSRCPECGADILRESAIRIGHRRPVLAGMVVGTFVALGGIGLCCAAIAAWWPTFDGSRYKTVGMLIRELDSRREPARAAACRELLRRADAASLSAAQSDQIAATILAWQADPAKAWDPRWGDVMEAERRSKNLTAEPWRRYLQAAIHITVAARPRVGMADPLPIAIHCTLKGGNRGSATFAPEMHVISAGKSTLLDAGSPQVVGWRYPSGDQEWDAHWLRDVEAAGKPTARIQVAMSIDDRGGTGATANAESDVTYEVLAAGQSSVALDVTPTPDEQREMAASIHWRLHTTDDGKVLLRDPAEGQRSDADLGSLFVSGPPVAMACRVAIRQSGREWTFARFLVRANDGDSMDLRLPKAAPGSGPRPGPAEIVCVPEADLAAQTVDVMEVWGREEHIAVDLAAGP